jgi:hypothetical protein
MRFAGEIARAEWVDMHEQATVDPAPLTTNGKRLSFSLKANSLVSLKVQIS